MSDNQQKIIIAYDGACPFCRFYVHMNRLENAGYNVQYINFRDNHNLVSSLRSKNMDPNDGFYLNINGQEYYADEAITTLSLLSTSCSLLHALIKWVFKNPKRAKILYPLLKKGRNTWLRLKKTPPI